MNNDSDGLLLTIMNNDGDGLLLTIMNNDATAAAAANHHEQ